MFSRCQSVIFFLLLSIKPQAFYSYLFCFLFSFILFYLPFHIILPQFTEIGKEDKKKYHLREIIKKALRLLTLGSMIISIREIYLDDRHTKQRVDKPHNSP